MAVLLCFWWKRNLKRSLKEYNLNHFIYSLWCNGYFWHSPAEKSKQGLPCCARPWQNIVERRHANSKNSKKQSHDDLKCFAKLIEVEWMFLTYSHMYSWRMVGWCQIKLNIAIIAKTGSNLQHTFVIPSQHVLFVGWFHSCVETVGTLCIYKTANLP